MGVKAHLCQPFDLQVPAMKAFQQMIMALTLAVQHLRTEVQQQGPCRKVSPGGRCQPRAAQLAFRKDTSPLHPAALFCERMSASKAGLVAEMLAALCCTAWPPLRPAEAVGQHYQLFQFLASSPLLLSTLFDVAYAALCTRLKRPHWAGTACGCRLPIWDGCCASCQV